MTVFRKEANPVIKRDLDQTYNFLETGPDISVRLLTAQESQIDRYKNRLYVVTNDHKQ